MPGEHDGLDRVVGLRATGAVQQVDPHPVSQGIVALRPMQGDDQQVAVRFGQHVLVFHRMSILFLRPLDDAVSSYMAPAPLDRKRQKRPVMVPRHLPHERRVPIVNVRRHEPDGR